MGADAGVHALVQSFRAKLRDALGRAPHFGPSLDVDRADGSALATRFQVAPRLWIEVCLRPDLPQLRVGVVTDDRWLSEDLETLIEDSGDTMSEFVELGFEEAGLTWREPIVEHFRDADKCFHFATSLDLPALSDLSAAATFDKVLRMAHGYYEAFKPGIRKAQAAAPTRPD